MKVKLGDVATYTNGYAFKPDDWSDIGLPIIRIQDLTGNSYKMNRYNGTYAEKYEINKGDVLISWSASLGIYIWQGEKAVLNQHIFKVLFDKLDISKTFFVYQVESILNKAKSSAHGATMKHLTKPVFDSLPFYLPDLNEQHHIAAVLDKVSDLIALRKKQLAKLDELVKARFVEMFLLEQNNQNKQTIGECCKLKSGTTLSLELENEGGDIPYIKVGDMNIKENLNYITTSSRFVSKATAGSGVFPTGSIIFPKRGGAIATNKKRLTSLPICADLNIMGVIPGNNLLPIYLFVYFLLIDLGTLDNGSSVPQINNKDIAPLYICIPSLKLQQVFVNFVEVVDKQKTTIKQSLEKLETLKKSLMQEYFG